MVQDARYRIKLALDTYILAANMLRTDALTALEYHVMFDDGVIPLKKMMAGSASSEKNLDVLYSIGQASSSPEWNFEHKTAYYIENVPVTIYAVDPINRVEGTRTLSTAHMEFRRVMESNFGGSLGVLRRISSEQPNTEDKGGWKLYSIKCVVEYQRYNTNFLPTYPTFSDHVAYTYEGDRLSGGVEGTWTLTQGSATGETTVTVGGSTTAISCNTAHMSDADDLWNGYYLHFLSGVNIGLSRLITDFGVVGGPAVATFTCSAFPSAYTAGDTFTIYGSICTQTVTSDNNLLLNQTVFRTDSSTVSGTNLGLSSTAYGRVRVRYKTSGAATAKVIIGFSSGTATVLSETASSTFTVVDVAITPAKTINTITLYCCDGVGTVTYDFVQIYSGNYILPVCLKIDPPQTLKDAVIKIPGMSGNLTQGLGTDLLEVTMDCYLDMEYYNLDSAAQLTWKRPQTVGTKTDYNNTDVFMELQQVMGINTAWVWLNLGNPKMQFKARLSDIHPSFTGDKGVLTLVWHEYRHGSASEETAVERYGMSL